MATEAVSTAIHQLCSELQKLWEFESFSFTFHPYTDIRKNFAKTEAAPNAHRLPKTNFPVRGHDGVELTYLEEKISNLTKTQHLVFGSYVSRSDDIAESDHKSALIGVNASVGVLVEALDKDQELCFRLRHHFVLY